MKKIIPFFSIILILVFLMGFLAKFHFFFDLISHFRLYFLLVFMIFFLGSILSKLKQWIFIHLFFILAILFSCYPFYQGDQQKEYSEKLKIVSANILSHNHEFDKLKQLIKKENPELILIQEINPLWEKALQEWATDYPHQMIKSRRDNFGMALYSKYPFSKNEFIYLTQEPIPYILATIKKEDKEISLLGVHAMPPMGSRFFDLRNRQLNGINEIAKNQNENLIVLGDLNCTSFSPCFNYLTKGTTLKDTRLGKGLQTSWSAKMNAIQITLDHAFVSENVSVLDRKLGNDIGSDHYPVILELGW